MSGALPPRSFDLTRHHFSVRANLDDVTHLLSSDPLRLQFALPADLDLHASSRAALDLVVPLMGSGGFQQAEA